MKITLQLLILAFLGIFANYSSQTSNTLFFQKGAEWKYLDNGTDQGTTWRNVNYSDSSWKVGSGHFGFGDGDEDTILKSGYITYYFRKKVNVADISKLPEKIFFHIVHDDAAVLYINNVEVMKSSLLPQTGTIYYNTGTTNFIPNDQENSFFTYEIPTSAFVNGENTIAIEVHNQKTSSSDVSFDCTVSKTNTAQLPFHKDGPNVFYEDNKIIVETITDAGLETKTYDADANVTLTIQDPTSSKTFDVNLKKQHLANASTYNASPKVFITSDIEGQFLAFKKMLINAKVMSEDFHWIFGDGHLFLNGDMLDRGPYVTETLWLIYKLEQEANNAGGKVHYIIGNHEVMNLTNDFRYVNQKYVENANYAGRNMQEYFSNMSEFGRWFQSKNIIERIGNYTLTHGGISPTVANLNLSYDIMNEFGRKKMKGESCTGDCATVTGGTATGLFWYRGITNQELTQEEVDEILNKVGTQKLILGHTVFPKVTTLYNGKIIAMDIDHKTNIASNKIEALSYENTCYKSFVSQNDNVSYTNLFADCKSTLETNNIANKSSISIFPNPTKDYLNVKSSDAKITSAEIFNTLGSRIINSNEQPKNDLLINLKSIEKGIYFLKIKTENAKEIIKKVIKE